MSFDIEKRFRFVSSDDINDDVKEEDYQANDEIAIEEEDAEIKKTKEKKEITGEGSEGLKDDFDDFKDKDGEEEEEEEDEEED